MQFFHAHYFMFLWAIPLIIAVHLFSRRLWESRMRRFGDKLTVEKKLIPLYRKSHWRARTILLALVFLFSILALARPQWGEEKKKVQRKGVDLIFMMDTSLSMLAEDIKPNRAQKSKMEIKSFVRSLKGDRVGMIAFAGSSFLQAPLTLDYAAFFLFLDGIEVGYIPDPGTSLSKAIGMAIRSFPKEQTKHKAVIVFTDGEDHEGGIDEVIKAAKESGTRIYTIGVGSEEGDPIPLKDESGRKSGFKKDRAGQVVVTKLNKPLLEKIASETGGVYLPSTPAENEVELVLKHLETLGQRQFKERMVAEKEDHYQIFILIALLFLLMEMMVRVRQKPPKDSFRGILPALMMFVLFSGFIDTSRSLNEKGNAEFEQKKFQTALENYRKAQVKNPEDPVILYNLAAGLYQNQEYQEAKKHLETAIAKTKDPELKAKALYNYGNTLYRLGDFEKSIESYKKALEINPDDKDAKYNLEFLQKSKNNFEKQNQDKQNESQKQDQKQNQQQQQKNEQQQQQNQQQKDPNQKNQQQPQDQQGQDQKDQQDQKGDQDNENQGESQEKKDDQQDNKQDPNQDPKDQQGDQNEDKQDQQPDQGEEQQEEPVQPEPKDEGEPQPASPDPEQSGEQPNEQSPQEEQSMGQENQDSQQRAPLQGQMTKDNALRILDAMKESEQELQDLRRPPAEHKDMPPAKDW